MRKVTFTMDSRVQYTIPELVGKDIVFLVIPPETLAEGDAFDQYTYTKATGTITFNFPRFPGQKVFAFYNP